MACTNRHETVGASMVSVKNIYYCPVCNRELKAGDICAIVGHTYKSCRYCHTDIKPVMARGV